MRIRVGQRSLDGVYRQEGRVWLLFGVGDEVGVYELLDFQIRRGDVLYYCRIVLYSWLMLIGHLPACELLLR